MITRRFLNISVFAIALSAVLMTLPVTQARADGNENRNATRENWPQQNAFPNQGQRNEYGNRYGNGNNQYRNNQNRGNGERQRNQNRFFGNNREGSGGHRGGDD